MENIFMKKTIISLQIPVELYQQIKNDADNEYLTVSAFIRRLLMRHYEENKICTDKSTK